MACTSEHSEADWLRCRDQICSLYIEENWTLLAVMKHMEEAEGFHATRSQYNKRLKKWGISKNLTKRQWVDQIVPEVVERMQGGKETAVNVNGRVISAKRLKTAISRYRPSGRIMKPASRRSATASAVSRSCLESVSAVVIGTPPPLSPQRAWMPPKSGGLMDMDVDSTTEDTAGPTSPALHETARAASPIDLSTLATSPFFRDCSPHPWLPGMHNDCLVSNVATQPLHDTAWSPFPKSPSPASRQCFGISWKFHMSQNLPFSRFQLRIKDIFFSPGDTRTPRWLSAANSTLDTPLQLSSAENTVFPIEPKVIHRTLLQILFHSRKHELKRVLHLYEKSLAERNKLHHCLLTALKGVIPERWDGDLDTKIRDLQDPTQSMRSLFEITVYLMSNNLADDARFEHVLNLMQIPQWRRQLLAFLKIEEQSIRAITHRVIGQAIRSDSAELIRDLHSEGFQFDDSQLVACCSTTRDMSLAKVLLTCRGSQCDPLNHEVGSKILSHLVEMGTVELIEVALQRIETHFGGAKGKLWRAARIHPATEATASRVCQLCYSVGIDLVMSAVYHGKKEIVRLLLEKGAHPHGDFRSMGVAPQHSRRPNATSLAASLGFSDIVALLESHGIPESPNGLPGYDRAIQGGTGLAPVQIREIDTRSLRNALTGMPIHDSDILSVPSIFNQFSSRDPYADELRHAVEHNQLTTARLLLDSADVNPNTTSTFSHDISWSHMRLQQQVSQKKHPLSSNLRIEVRREVTLLQIATFYGHLDMVDLLIEKGAAQNLAPEKFHITTKMSSIHMHLTPLQLAVFCGNPETARRLLTKGADVDARRDIRTPTPLILAAKTLHLEFIGLLLDHGADVNACCFVNEWHGWTTAMLAAVDGTNDWAGFDNEGEEVFRLLLARGADINGPPAPLRGGMETTILQEVLMHQVSPKTIDFALAAGAEIRGCGGGRSKRTALQVACIYSDLEVVELLLRYGADANEVVPTDCQLTALQLAAFREIPSIDIVQALIRRGADVNAKAGYDGGITALQAAATAGHVPVAQVLLEAGSEVNAGAAAKHGGTAVELAAEHGRLDMVDLLLQNGAVGDVEGWTLLGKAIDKARRNGHSVIVKILEDRMEQLVVMSFEEILSNVAAQR